MKNFIAILFFSITSLSLSVFGQTGVFKSYYMNGKKSAEISYSDGIYYGVSVWYYENGNIQEIKTYSNGKVNGWCKTFYESGLLKEEKYVVDGYIDGILKRYYSNGALKDVITFERGKQVKAIHFDYDPFYQAPIEAYQAGNKQQVEEKKSDEFLCDVDICPLPLGGKDAIYRHLVYPADAKAYGLEGEVKLVATIDKDGKVIDAKVIKGIGLGCDEAAIEAVKETRFLPGQNSNGPTTANVTFSLEFNLKVEEKVAATKQNLPNLSDTQLSYKEPEIGEYTKGSNLDKVSNKPYSPESVEPNIIDTSSNKPKPVRKLESYFSCNGYDTCAEPKGGINAILKNFTIPRKVKENNVKGNVVVLCDVDETGKVRNTTVINGLPYGGGVAVEVALLYTEFEPATKNGKPVRSNVTVTVPVDY